MPGKPLLKSQSGLPVVELNGGSICVWISYLHVVMHISYGEQVLQYSVLSTQYYTRCCDPAHRTPETADCRPQEFENSWVSVVTVTITGHCQLVTRLKTGTRYKYAYRRAQYGVQELVLDTYVCIQWMVPTQHSKNKSNSKRILLPVMLAPLLAPRIKSVPFGCVD